MNLRLEIYRRNSLGDADPYICQNLYFGKNVYIGRRRDDKDIMVIRRFLDGDVTLKNADDFDALKDYIYSAQDAILYYGPGTGEFWKCKIELTNPNFFLKTLKVTFRMYDDYSQFIDGELWGNNSISKEPTIQALYKPSDFYSDVTPYFFDGSQYRYDAEAPGSELWGLEQVTINEAKDVYVTDTLLLNYGGEGQDGDELTIAKLLPKVEYLDFYYKPTYIKWSNVTGTGGSRHFQNVLVYYKREYRYFEETEKVPDGWNLVFGTRTKNGFTYKKYVREIYGDQTFLQNENIYFIRNEEDTFDYIAATFAGHNTDLQKSDTFYQLNEVLELLIRRASFSTASLISDIHEGVFIGTMKRYNGGVAGEDQLRADVILNDLRDRLGYYYSYNSNLDSFYIKSFEWKTELMAIDSFYPDQPIDLDIPAKIIDFEGGGFSLDFGKQTVTFYGLNSSRESISPGMITNLEDDSDSESELLLVQTNEAFIDQIYDKFTHSGDSNGTEALWLSADGKYVSWDTDKLDLSTYLQFDLLSNVMYLDVSDEIQVSYSVVIYAGSVQVRVGNYNATHTITANVNTTTYLTGNRLDYFRVTMASSTNAKGFISNISVKIKSKVPYIRTGVISGRALKNGNLAAANTLINYKPLLSYKKGYLTKYGDIDCNPKFNKKIEKVSLPLNENIFAWDMDKYLTLNSEKYLIFEEKRQIISEDEISKHTIINCKTNEIY